MARQSAKKKKELPGCKPGQVNFQSFGTWKYDGVHGFRACDELQHCRGNKELVSRVCGLSLKHLSSDMVALMNSYFGKGS